MEISFSDLMQAIVKIDNKNLDFNDFFYQRDIYDLDLDTSPSIVLKTSRQVGKSTAIIGKILGESRLKPFFKSLYVSPTKEQTERFSKLLNSVLKQSPFLKDFIGENNKISHKTFTNGSEIYFSYASHDSERIRGLANIGLIAIDEIQSIENPDVIPVILEVSAESQYGYTLYCGTPLSNGNIIEHYWQNSIQHEWVVKCDSCGKYNVPHTSDDMLKMIGKKGPICIYCKSDLFPPEGQWAIVNDPPENIYRRGFHVTRILRYPLNEKKRAKQWRDVLTKLEEYPENRFLNEVLGVSVEIGGSIITEEELAKVTLDLPMASKKEPIYRIPRLIMGIDWGVSGGVSGGMSQSFTAVSIGGYDLEGKYKVIFGKKYYDSDILKHIQDILSLVNKFNVEYVAADFGVGKTNNAILRQHLGPARVFEMQYVSQNVPIKHNKESGIFTIDKTTQIEYLVHGIKTKNIFFTKGMESLLQDFLSVYEEETHTGKKVFRRKPNRSDDFLHSVVFQHTAANTLGGFQ